MEFFVEYVGEGWSYQQGEGVLMAVETQTCTLSLQEVET